MPFQIFVSPPISRQWSVSTPPEKIRKPKAFWYFQGLEKESNDKKQVKLFVVFTASVLQPISLTLHSAKTTDNVFCKAPEFDTLTSSFANDIFELLSYFLGFYNFHKISRKLRLQQVRRL